MIRTAIICGVVGCSFTPGAFPLGGADDVDAAPASADSSSPASSADGGVSDATTAIVTLRETIGDSGGQPSDACFGPLPGQSRDAAYWRVFPLPSFAAVAGSGTASFHATGVSFRVSSAIAADANGVGVHLGIYAGATGQAIRTLDPSLVTWLAQASIDISGSASSQMVTALIAADVPATATIAIAVEIPPYNGVQLAVDSTTGPQAQLSYYASTACGIANPTSMDGGGSVGTFVIDVLGYVQ